MKEKKEKNITEFNRDVDSLGRYVYTDKDVYSLFTARKRQADEIINTLTENFKKNIRVLDVGCGDGAFAFELMNRVKPKYYLGVDAAKKAVESAKKRIPKKLQKRMFFKQVNIYELDSKIKDREFDVMVIWGVLHHLYDPKKAIAQIGKVANQVIILEANGYNPLLKIIEKVSPYHRKHEEKSYFPILLNKWFQENGYEVKKHAYSGIVPYFCNEKIARALKAIEPLVERIPLINAILCGTVLLYYVKKD